MNKMNQDQIIQRFKIYTLIQYIWILILVGALMVAAILPCSIFCAVSNCEQTVNSSNILIVQIMCGLIIFSLTGILVTFIIYMSMKRKWNNKNTNTYIPFNSQSVLN